MQILIDLLKKVDVAASKRLFKALNSSAKRRGIEQQLTFVEFLLLRSKQCFYCSADLPKKGAGIDRISSSSPYVAGNVVPCCGPCNYLKNNYIEVDEMFVLLRALAVMRRCKKGEVWLKKKSTS